MVGECAHVQSHGSRSLRSLDVFRPEDTKLYQYIQAYGRVYGTSIYRLHHGGLIVIVEIVEWREFLHSVVYVNTENKKLKEHIP